ncbi:MAG: NAD-dependent epimerase/dehydratase family protein [Balneolaceae bacterium]
MSKILITGANGQLGSELTDELRRIYGVDHIISSDIVEPGPNNSTGIFEYLDVLDSDRFREVIVENDITQIYHLAALLSANAEKNLNAAWKLNMDGLLNALHLANENNIEKIFWPSSIAVFGPDAVKNRTPQESPCNPATVYGITKVSGEQWCAYYHRKFGVDVRSIRYPGLIGYKSLPGGGTTDYAVEIYHKALAGETFSCFLEKNSALPMMYMSDAVKATVELMNAPVESISVRTSYNVSAISFTPEEIGGAIQKRIPEFVIRYEPDYRQEIASSWPNSIDDTQAKHDWDWKPDFDLEKMTDDMLKNLPKKSEKDDTDYSI